jgi:hypothetical protein
VRHLLTRKELLELELTLDGPPGIAACAWQDTTGTLTGTTPPATSPHSYLRALSGFHHARNGPRTFARHFQSPAWDAPHPAAVNTRSGTR